MDWKEKTLGWLAMVIAIVGFGLAAGVYGDTTYRLDQLTAISGTPTTDDLLLIMDDPASTKLTRKVTIANLFSGLTLNLLPTTGTWAPTGTLNFSGATVNLAGGTVTYDPEVQALAATTSAANKLFYFTGSGSGDVTDLSAFARSILDDADAIAVRSTLGLVIGTNVQAYSAALALYAAISPSSDIQTFLGYANFAAMKTGLSISPLITLSGVADGATHLGTFTGTTIADGSTIKAALQALETYAEAIAGGVTELSADESADATLTALGGVHIRGDEDRLSIHFGAGREIAGEATKSFLEHVALCVDPGAHYDTDEQIYLFKVQAKVYPNGITIDYWETSCNANPDVEIDANLKYADAWIGLANAAVIDALDTTDGASSEDTDANINGGAVVAAGKIVYIEFDGDPEGTCVQWCVEIIFHAEED